VVHESHRRHRAAPAGEEDGCDEDRVCAVDRAAGFGLPVADRDEVRGIVAASRAEVAAPGRQAEGFPPSHQSPAAA